MSTQKSPIFVVSPLCILVAACMGLSACTTIATAPTKPQAESTPAVAPPDPPPATAAQAIPIDPLRPDEKVDLNAPITHVDLWARVRKGFAMPNLQNELVQDREQWYSTRPDYVQRMMGRGSRYLFHVVEEVERRGMPTELALLPFIESAFNPQAVSSAKASGMWQFMPATGRHFELRQNIFRDDRRDVLASTRAALDYLTKLHDMFGDWHLALAAYNWGEGSVQRAINRNQAAGLPTDYLSLKMPLETRYYVPKLQAIKNIVAQPDQFGLSLPPLENHPYFLSVPIEKDIDVALAIDLAGVTRDEFLTLNPQMKKPVILAAGTPQVLLPYNNAGRFVQNLRSHRGPLASWTAWAAPRTLRLREAAAQVGMTTEHLRRVNAIPPSMMVKAGSTLLVPRHASKQRDVPEQVADHASIALTPEPPPIRKVAIRASRRDTVASIAKRYRVSASQVASWNKGLTHGRLKAGQTVVLFVPVKARHGHRYTHHARHYTGRAHASHRRASAHHAGRAVHHSTRRRRR